MKETRGVGFGWPQRAEKRFGGCWEDWDAFRGFLVPNARELRMLGVIGRKSDGVRGAGSRLGM